MNMHKNIVAKEGNRKDKIARMRKNLNMIHISVSGIVIVIMSIVLSQIIPQSTTAQENIQANKIVEKMAEIDDMGHQYNRMLHDIGSGYNLKRDRVYHIADNKYHATQYRNEKYKAAIELNALIVEQNTFIHQLIQKNPFSENAKIKFDQLQQDIKKLQTQ